MKQRNWLALGRKKIDAYDLDASFNWIQQHFGYLTLSYYGFGVQQTTQYPNPFPITVDANDMNGAVGPGIAFDPVGMLTRISALSTTPKTFSISAADNTNPRWDLLVLRYVQGTDTLIPSPSNPLVQVPLNLHDDFQLVVRSGVPSNSPAYPAKVTGDIILAGLRVPPNTVNGSNVVVDLGIRELAQPAAALRAQVVEEVLGGTVDGVNAAFTMSQPPMIATGVVVFLDALKQDAVDFTVSGQTVTFTSPPAAGVVPSAFYIANSASTANPLAVVNEDAVGVSDGVNALFTLSGQPANKSSTLVFVNGIKANKSDWSLIQGVANGSIQFVASAVPPAGESVSVLYFVNPATVGTAPASSGGGTSGTTEHLEYPVLSATDISNGYISLSALPKDPTKVVLDVSGAGCQIYGIDFTVSGQILTFAGDLATPSDVDSLAAGDQLRISYWS